MGAAALVQRGERHVIVEGLAFGGYRRSAALDAGRGLHLDLRLSDDDAADPILRVLLHRRERAAPAVGNARRDRQDLPRVIFAPPLHVGASVRRRRPVLLVEHVVRELDRVKGVLAPVDLGGLLRMRVLDGESIRARGVERRSIRVAQVRGEVRLRAGIRRVAAQAVNAIDGIVLQVVDTHPAALVGVRHRTSMLEPPLPRSGDGAVDPARTRGRSSHDAGVARDERGQRVIVGAGAGSGDGDKREHDALRHGSSEAILRRTVERVATEVKVGKRPPTPRDMLAGMRNLLAVAALLLAFALGAGLVWHLSHREARLPDAPALVLKIREVARLETLDVSLYKKIDFSPDPREQATVWASLAQWASYTVRPPRGRAIVFAVAHLGLDLRKPAT